MLKATPRRLLEPFARLLAALVPSAIVSSLAVAAMPADSRETAPFDRGWQFPLGEAEGAEKPAYDDASWRTLDHGPGLAVLQSHYNNPRFRRGDLFRTGHGRTIGQESLT